MNAVNLIASHGGVALGGVLGRGVATCLGVGPTLVGVAIPQSGWIEVTLDRERAFNTLVLVEPVGRWKDYGESRIASYRFESWIGGTWVEIAAGQVPTRVQIHQVPRLRSQRVRLGLVARHDTPHITEIGIYDEPVRR